MLYSFIFKYTIVGPSGVGKSSLLKQFQYQKFDNNTDPTIGVEFGTKIIELKNSNSIKIQAWDCAGLQSFRPIIRTYNRKTAVTLVVFDLCNYKSLKQTEEQIDELNPNSTLLVLVGNKADVIHRRQVGKNEAKDFAFVHKMMYFETSAKTALNVERLFKDTAQVVYDNIEAGNVDITDEDMGIKEGAYISLETDENNGNLQQKKCCRI